MKNKVAEICLNFSVMSFIVGNTTSNLLLLLSFLQFNVDYHIYFLILLVLSWHQLLLVFFRLLVLRMYVFLVSVIYTSILSADLGGLSWPGNRFWSLMRQIVFLMWDLRRR